jgi:hypothetical protein
MTDGGVGPSGRALLRDRGAAPPKQLQDEETMPQPLLLACFTALALLGCAGTASPPATAPAAATPTRPAEIALALGGGAARGFAHSGVIKVLDPPAVSRSDCSTPGQRTPSRCAC